MQLLTLLACGRDVPAVTSIRVEDVIEVTTSGAVWPGAVAVLDNGEDSPVEVLVISSSEPDIVAAGGTGSFECLRNGISTVTLQAESAVATFQVYCTLVAKAELSRDEVDIVFGPDEESRALARIDVVLTGPGGELVEGVTRSWTSGDAAIVELVDGNALNVVGLGTTELEMRAGHVVEHVPVQVGRLLYEEDVVVEEGGRAQLPVEPGRYRVDVESDRPVAVLFEGADCTSEGTGTELSVGCTLERKGFVEVANAARNGIQGPDANAHVIVVAYPR